MPGDAVIHSAATASSKNTGTFRTGPLAARHLVPSRARSGYAAKLQLLPLVAPPPLRPLSAMMMSDQGPSLLPPPDYSPELPAQHGLRRRVRAAASRVTVVEMQRCLRRGAAVARARAAARQCQRAQAAAAAPVPFPRQERVHSNGLARLQHACLQHAQSNAGADACSRSHHDSSSTATNAAANAFAQAAWHGLHCEPVGPLGAIAAMPDRFCGSFRAAPLPGCATAGRQRRCRMPRPPRCAGHASGGKG